MMSPETEARIQKSATLAQSLNIRGTPAFVIGGELIPGAVDAATLKSLIAKARKGG
jgi:protein-disulfide isomerase